MQVEEMELQSRVCEVCGQFMTGATCKHQLGQKDNKNYFCTHCGKDFLSSYNLQYHIAHYLNQRNFACTQCPKAFNTAADLKQHSRAHDAANLKASKKRAYKKDPKECPVCGKIVQNVNKHHNAVHLNIRNYECKICQKRFNKKAGLDRHFLIVHEQQRNHVCDLCGKTFGEKSLLTRHKSRHDSIRTSFYCTVCKKYVGELKDHFETTHMDFRYHCEHCHRRFEQKHDLKRHVTSMHTKVRKWLCDLCGKGFVEKYQLKKHVKAHNIAGRSVSADVGTIKPVTAIIRKKQKSLNKSVKETYDCNVCGKAFAGRKTLTKHLATHENKKENYCNICKLYDENIKLHYETEHNDLEFTCEICYKKFSREIQLKKHNQTNHSGVTHTCDICGKIFNSQAAIKNHIKLHIPNEKASESEDTEFQAAFFDQNDLYSNDEEETDYFEPEAKFMEIEKIVVETIYIKKEPEESFNNIKCEYPTAEVPVKSETFCDLQTEIDIKQEEIQPKVSKVRKKVTKKREMPKESDEDEEKSDCNFCKESFESKEAFRQHFMAKHLRKSKSTYLCDKCDKIFDSRKDYNIHVKTAHHDCQHCTEKFTTKSDLEEHFKAMHSTNEKPTEQQDGKSYTCPICDKKHPSKAALLRHKDREHKTGRKYKCPKCPQQFTTLHELRLHTEHHHNINRKNVSDNYACIQCGVCFPTIFSLTKHGKIVHGDVRDKNRECEICGEVFSGSYYKQKHSAQVHLNGKKLKRSCGYCNMEFVRHDEYKTHIQSHNGVYICVTCGSCHFDAESLKLHETTHKMIDVSLRKYSCDQCGHRAFSKDKIIIHMLNHLKTLEEHYCDICGKGFKFASSLYTHRKFHGEGKFECKFCGKKFAVNSSLVMHLRTHTNEKPFKCTVCDRGFAVKLTLTNHLQTHPETRKLFKCKQCGVQFADKKQLIHHEDQAHPEARPFRCFICDISYKQEHHLKKHNSVKHL